MPASRPTLAQARAWCRKLATTHYENFHVATWFLPRAARPHFESIYAFSRVADDLGDEVADSDTALRLLREWRDLLRECYAEPERSQHLVFVALQATIADILARARKQENAAEAEEARAEQARARVPVPG